MKKSLLLAIGALLIAGCTVTKAVRMSENTYPPISPERVRVFTSEDEITAPFEKIAIITSEGDSSQKTTLIEKMKKKAAELGANGIILGQFKEATTGQKVAQALLWTSANNKYEAIAVRLKTKKRVSRPAPIEEE